MVKYYCREQLITVTREIQTLCWYALMPMVFWIAPLEKTEKHQPILMATWIFVVQLKFKMMEKLFLQDLHIQAITLYPTLVWFAIMLMEFRILLLALMGK